MLWLLILQEKVDEFHLAVFGSIVPGFPSPIEKINIKEIHRPVKVIEYVISCINGQGAAHGTFNASLESETGGFIYMCIYIYIYIYACTHAHTHARTHACMHACMHRYSNTTKMYNFLLLWINVDNTLVNSVRVCLHACLPCLVHNH